MVLALGVSSVALADTDTIDQGGDPIEVQEPAALPVEANEETDDQSPEAFEPPVVEETEPPVEETTPAPLNPTPIEPESRADEPAPVAAAVGGGASAPYISVSVKDPNGALVGGASIRIEGSRDATSGDDSDDARWGAFAQDVEDCIAEPCVGVEKNPAPGEFDIESIASESGVHRISDSARYRVQAASAPEGYEWSDDSEWEAIPGTAATPAPEAWENETFDAETLVVEPTEVPADDAANSSDEMIDQEFVEEITEQSGAEDGQIEFGARSSEFTPFSATSCSYADAGTGAYASTLCWLDMTGFSTEWKETSRQTTGSGSSWSTTLVYDSVLGSQYGTATFTRTGNSRNNSITNAETARNNTLFRGPISGTDSTERYFGPVTNFPVSVVLSSDYTLTANLSVTSPTSANNAGLRVTSNAFPTYDMGPGQNGAFLGRNGFYMNVAGEPAIYQRVNADSARTQVSLGNIQVTGPSGVVTGYSIVVADAETTDQNEWIEWTHTGGTGFRWLPNNPEAWTNATSDAQRRVAAIGNACTGGTPNSLFGANSSTTAPNQTVRCATTSVVAVKTGTAMLQISPSSANSPFTVTQVMQGNGLQAVAFGVVFGGAQLDVKVQDRVKGATDDVFTGELTAEGLGSYSITTGSTGGQIEPASTGAKRFPLAGYSEPKNLTFESSSSEAEFSSSYSQEWVCLKTTPGSSVQLRWPAAGSSAAPPSSSASDATEQNFARVSPGEFIKCTVTYVPPYVTLIKELRNPLPGWTATASDWTLTAALTGAPEISGSTGEPAVTSVPVRIGAYDLSESGPAGYLWTELTCEPANSATVEKDGAGVVTAATVTVAKGSSIDCTFVNSPSPGELTITKAFDASVPSGSTGTFSGSYVCELPADTVVASGAWASTGAGVAVLTAAEGSPAADAIPQGALCSATETAPTGSDGLPNSSWQWGTPTVGDPVTIGAAAQNITVTNKAAQSFGNFSVTKVVPVGSVVTEGMEFGGDYVCELDGSPVASGSWGPITAGGTWTSTLDSKIPLGASCTVTETRTGEPVDDGSYVWDGDPVIAGSPAVTKASDYNVVTVTNTTKQGPGSVTWSKVDNTGAVLSGSEWSLQGPGEGGDPVAVIDCTVAPCTGPDMDPVAGQFEIIDLEWGTYTLIETKAPAGFYPGADKPFTIGSGEALNISLGGIENTRITGPDIPLTGGLGRDAFLIGGLGVLTLGMGAAVMAEIRNRRREVA